MNEQYEKELKELRLRMEGAEAFAEKIPIFKKQIIESKITGEESSLNFGYKYKDIPLGWGIRRYLFVGEGSGPKITNLEFQNPGQHPDRIYLFKIYINSICLFDEHCDFNLEQEVASLNKHYFFDRANTTFYVKDEYIETFLSSLNKWYLKSLEKLGPMQIDRDIKRAEKRLEKLREKAKS